MNHVPPTFGARFLDELRRIGQPTGENYATLQRIKLMEREELLQHALKVAGTSYAEVQQLKTLESPVELARELARLRTANNQALLLAILIATG